MEKRLLNTKETMVYLGIQSKRTLDKLVADGKLLNVGFGRFLKFDKNDVDAFIEKQKKNLTIKAS